SLGFVALAGVVILCGWVYDRVTSPRRWLPGTYTANSWDGKGTTTLRLAPDVSAVWETIWARQPQRDSRNAGRWRVPAGRDLVHRRHSDGGRPSPPRSPVAAPRLRPCCRSG